MRMAKTDIIAGPPAPAARDFLRRIRFADFHEKWSLALLASHGASDPHATLLGFEDGGYVERADQSPGDAPWWTTTTLRNALAMASFGKPITRETADRLVAEMVDRARAYNSDFIKPCFVQRLRFFGSYLDRTVDPLGSGMSIMRSRCRGVETARALPQSLDERLITPCSPIPKGNSFVSFRKIAVRVSRGRSGVYLCVSAEPWDASRAA